MGEPFPLDTDEYERDRACNFRRADRRPCLISRGSTQSVIWKLPIYTSARHSGDPRDIDPSVRGSRRVGIDGGRFGNEATTNSKFIVRERREERRAEVPGRRLLFAITVLDRPRTNHSHDRRRSRGTLNFAFRSATEFLRATVRACSISRTITSPIGPAV